MSNQHREFLGEIRELSEATYGVCTNIIHVFKLQVKELILPLLKKSYPKVIKSLFFHNNLFNLPLLFSQVKSLNSNSPNKGKLTSKDRG